ncbi:hypothetical protein KIN20_013018 [Parelaphostrongylus tenuis]|uniref:Uncharacterized protein n=1 Tax=Parelaphostrongylus tenuis TaxID=148309 RepID=A0AAD5MXL9_PARTN|nr:hypothetical protein KIN20_013018 [Parelaphostrongylus tenuis]
MIVSSVDGYRIQAYTSNPRETDMDHCEMSASRILGAVKVSAAMEHLATGKVVGVVTIKVHVMEGKMRKMFHCEKFTPTHARNSMITFAPVKASIRRRRTRKD